MATQAKGSAFLPGQSGSTIDPRLKASKSRRLAPGKMLRDAEREDEPVSPDAVDDVAARPYQGDPAGAGITNLRPDAEEEQQDDLPPRGSRKKSYHA